MISSYIFFRVFLITIWTVTVIESAELTPYQTAESQYSPSVAAPNIQHLVQRYSSPAPSYSPPSLPSSPYDSQLLPYTSVQQSPSYADNAYASTESDPVSYK